MMTPDMNIPGMKATNTAAPAILRATLLTLLLTSLPASLLSEGTPAAGKEKAKVCEACHVIDNHSLRFQTHLFNF